MKTILALALGLLCALDLHAQATNVIQFQNDNASLITNGLSGAPVRTNDTFIRAQLFFAPDGITDEAAFLPLGATTLVGTPAGRYNGGNRTLGALPAGSFMIQVRAHETSYGSNYTAAEAAPAFNGRRALIGKSAIARVSPLGSPGVSNAISSKVVGPFTLNIAGGGTHLVVNDTVAAEGSNGVAQASFIVRLLSPQAGLVSVNFATQDGTARAGEDYVAANGTVVFAPGEVAKTVSVVLTADVPPEPDETFYLNLSNPVNGGIVRSQGSCLITEVRVTGLSIDTSVSFNTITNRHYVVEKTLDSMNWQIVAGATNVTGTGSMMTIVDRGSGCSTMTLYRARLIVE